MECRGFEFHPRQLNSIRQAKKKIPHLAGLEPATFRLTAERANRLRHKCLPASLPAVSMTHHQPLIHSQLYHV